jgi:hypothetical protein
MSENPYLRLRALVTGDGAYAAMSAADAEAALNDATVPTAGVCLLAPDEFVDLFTAAEFVAVEDSPDPRVRKLVFRLRTRQAPLDMNSPTVQQGLAHMAAIGLLTPERAAAIGAAPAGPNITPREQIAWPGPHIYAADVIAAREMEG